MRQRLVEALASRLPFFYGWVILACVCAAGFSRQGPAVATLEALATSSLRRGPLPFSEGAEPEVTTEELEARFIEEAAKQNLKTLKGHRSVGGIRASIYNAFPAEGVDALIAFMKEFESEHG